MIRTNLSTRPFYNEAAVRTWLIVLALLVVATTVFNVRQLLHYARTDTDLASQASRDEHRAVELRADAKRLRASVNTAQVEAVSADAERANELIGRRTFSWTEVLNRFEATLPAEVRITALRQTVNRDRGYVLNIAVVARNVDDVNQFIENLSETGAFSSLQVPVEQLNPESGFLEATLEAVYRPASSPGSPGSPAPAPSPKSKRPAR